MPPADAAHNEVTALAASLDACTTVVTTEGDCVPISAANTAISALPPGFDDAFDAGPNADVESVLPSSSASATALASAISFAAAKAGARVLELLMGKYQLCEHLSNLKEYLLLGKGDFVQGLMEPLLPQLSRPASQLHRHHVRNPLTPAEPVSIRVAFPCTTRPNLQPVATTRAWLPDNSPIRL